MYKIGNVIIILKGLKKANESICLKLFQTQQKGKYNVEYNVHYAKKFETLKNYLCIYSNNQFAVIINNNRKLFCYILDQKVYAILEELEEGKKYELYLNSSFFKGNIHEYLIPSLLEIERSLIKQNSLVLHSSYLSKKNEAILFTAPSGGGKSTQAELWKKYKNAEIVNGDKSIIGKENGKWYAYGIPFSGSSEYCLNRTCALKAIVILDKGPMNTLVPVGIRGFSNVFSQVTVNPWDKEFCNKAMDLVMDVCNEVPIYYYSCTKTPEAVEVLYQEFIEKGILNGSV